MRVFPFSILCLLAAAPGHGQTVSDGDTLKFGTQRVRMFGIDAPETRQTCDGGAWPAGKIATETLKELIGDTPVICRQLDWDAQYGRPVSLCYAGDVDLSAAMVARGMAWAFVKYSLQYLDAERRAVALRLGVHGHRCKLPWEWRAELRQR
jgi:endonuclease YncB( thermonuclease family)